MGSDFVEKATQSFNKGWDRAKIRLGTADLFTRTPSCAARTVVADIIGNAQLKLGERLTVEVRSGELIARRGIHNVARVVNPAPIVLQAVMDSCGIAKGTVEQIHIIADVAEISLC